MNEVQRSTNPFGSSEVSTATSTEISESARAVEEVQASLVIAKKFPRDSMRAVDRIINTCSRPALAEKALYVYARGGTEITGPSIRLAEAIAQEWGNMQFGIRELSAGSGNSTVEAFAWDMETNTRQVKVFQVPHWRHTKQGGYPLKDPRDIYELVANQGARRLRACILGIIPSDVIETAVDQCHLTQKANIDTTPEGIKKMLAVFESKFKVSQELIEQRIQRRVESITPAQMQTMLNIAQSLRDGMSKPSDWFDTGELEPTAEAKKSSLTDEVKKGKGGKKPEPDQGEAESEAEQPNMFTEKQ